MVKTSKTSRTPVHEVRGQRLQEPRSKVQEKAKTWKIDFEIDETAS